MPVSEAWKLLKVEPKTSRGEIKKAFRQRVREVHPDVTGDDGTMLQRVRDAYEVLESISDPTAWDGAGMEEGLPSWAAGLLQGVEWSSECGSYAEFLQKEDQKALAVGEFNERTGKRPWAAAWGKYSQQEANAEALRVCRQYGTKCKLVYVGSGTARRAPTGQVDPATTREEKDWWGEQFRGGGEIPGFGWMPVIDPSKEKVVGYKTVDGGDRFGGPEARVRVPVFRGAEGGLPYYYSPVRPKERVFMKNTAFKHIRKMNHKSLKADPRIKQAKEMSQRHNLW